MKIHNLAIVGGLMVAAGVATIACSGDDDDTSSPKLDASADAIAPKLDAAADAATKPDHLIIKGFVSLVVTNQIEKNGGNELSYFVPNTVAVHPKPTLDDIEECLAYQFGAVLGNGDTYPPTSADGGTLLASGYACRPSMSTIHQPLFITNPIFNEFVADILAEAALQTPPLVFTSQQSAAILGLQGQVVEEGSPDASLPFGWQIDAGADAAPADAATSDASDAGDGGDADAGTK